MVAGDDDGVDGEVGGYVPQLVWFFEASRDVLEDEVVEFVDEYAANICFAE